MKVESNQSADAARQFRELQETALQNKQINEKKAAQKSDSRHETQREESVKRNDAAKESSRASNEEAPAARYVEKEKEMREQVRQRDKGERIDRRA